MNRILAATLFLLVACPLAGQTVTAGSAAALCGRTVEIPISVDAVAGMLALEVRIDYDASKLTAKSVVTGDLTREFQIASNMKADGLVRIAMAAARPVSGSGPVAKVIFAAARGAAGAAAISIGGAVVNETAAKAAGGTVTIDCPPAPAKVDPGR